jgi:DNA (cytosine-5)-methyltransferase 1
MSIAGKRAGLDGSRSNLFYEAVRIAKEMRCATNGRYPKWLCWENVPGAFSSNGGEDFRCVLETLCRIKDETVSVPMPDKWTAAGEIVGEDYSVAWRVLDACMWGVPQRRKRILLIAGLADERAGEILFESEGLSGYSAEGFRAWQSIAGCASQCSGAPKLCLNDQGGAFIEVTDDVAATLRAETHGHPPCVLESAGFCTEHSAKAGNIGYEEETAPTLRAGVVPAAIALDNHPADGRVRLETDGRCQTLTSRMGTGGNNVPLLLKIRSGCDGGGKGPLWQEDRSATLGCNNDQTLFEPVKNTQRTFGIGAYNSEGMRSGNPDAGFYEAETARTLDTSNQSPDKNQGGIAVVAFTQNQRAEVRELGDQSGALAACHGSQQQTFVAEPDTAVCIQGSMIGRQDCNGPQGNGVNEDVSFTLNTTDRHAVFAMTTGSYTQVEENQSPTLMARDYKDPACVTEPSYGIGRDAFNQGQNAKFNPAVAEETQPTLVAKGPGGVARPEPEYTVRRLTPTECARLQGFPDWWCADLGTENPTEEEIAYWRNVFLTHDRITGKAAKPKTDKQIIKWLRDPHTDGAEYRLWGNGVALPVVYFVLAGIAWAAGKNE